MPTIYLQNFSTLEANTDRFKMEKDKIVFQVSDIY